MPFVSSRQRKFVMGYLIKRYDITYPFVGDRIDSDRIDSRDVYFTKYGIDRFKKKHKEIGKVEFYKIPSSMLMKQLIKKPKYLWLKEVVVRVK